MYLIKLKYIPHIDIILIISCCHVEQNSILPLQLEDDFNGYSLKESLDARNKSTITYSSLILDGVTRFPVIVLFCPFSLLFRETRLQRILLFRSSSTHPCMCVYIHISVSCWCAIMLYPWLLYIYMQRIGMLYAERGGILNRSRRRPIVHEATRVTPFS